MTGIDIILYLIALGVCILIGVAAAYERVLLYDFAIVGGFWFHLYLLFIGGSLGWLSLVYLIVLIGTIVFWGGK